MRLPPQFLAIALSGLSLQIGAESTQKAPELEPAKAALAEYLPDIAAKRLLALLKEDALAPEVENEARLLLAEALIRSGQPQKVAETLSPLPETPARHYWTAISLSKTGKTTAALEKLALIPTEATPYWQQASYNRVEILLTRGEAALALPLIASLREQDPEFQPDTLPILEAQLHLQNNEPEKARKALTSLVELSPQAFLLSGQIELADNQASDALSAFTKAIDSSATPLPVQRLALLGQVDALLSQGQPSDALRTLITILATEPEGDFLAILHPRFEKLFALPPEDHTKEEPNDPESSEQSLASHASLLREFVSPETLGEDANYATPAKELAFYYLSRNMGAASGLPLLEQLLTFNPDPALAARAEFTAADFLFQQDKPKEAAARLARIKELQPKSDLAAQAADLLARLAAGENDLASARDLFAQAALHPNSDFSEQALLNQTLLTLQSGKKNKSTLSAIASRLVSNDARATFLLEKNLAEARSKSPNARENLEQFLAEHPQHPRTAEAQLALANLLLDQLDPEAEPLLKELLNALPANFPDQSLSQQRFEVTHRLGAITNDWSSAVTAGEAHLKAFPASETDPYFLLRLAESRYRNADYNRARYLFTETSHLENAGELSDVALYFAALANLAIPTEDATNEALAILKELTSSGGPLATDARILQARTLLKNLGEARKCLEALAYLPGKPGDQPDAALLTAEAYRELGSEDSTHYQKAISLYQRLLADSRTSYQLSNQIHYLISRTYRESGRPELALEPCLSVVDFENKPEGETQPEWDYYYQCGFEALDILLEAERNRAAFTLARKLAKTQGPGAEDAKKRADQIQLDHLLWTD